MQPHDQDEALLLRQRLARKRPLLEQRAAIIRAIRASFDTAGFLEVDTPLRIAAPAPELHIDATRSDGRYLITSPELQMKRLVAAGYERTYQLCHCFRQGERGARHLPEFTMIEWYRDGGTIADLMADCERLVTDAAKALCRFPHVDYLGATLDLTPPWPRLEVAEAFARFAGWSVGGTPDPERFDRDLVEKVEPALPSTRPVFLAGYPASLAALSQIDPDNPERALRFELYLGGLELANGFGELTDPVEQRARFEREAEERRQRGQDVYPLDERFLCALELGLPPCAGIALGVDRLVMLLTGAASIDEITAFPEELA